MQPITIHQDGYAEVHLAHGYVAKIDIEDIPLIQGFTWRVWNQHRRQYARTTLRKAGKRTELAMHRLLMNADSDVLVDHINHDALDNRRTNLRLCNAHQNLSNRRKCIGKTSSQYKGVIYRRRIRQWEANICFNYRHHHLGYFADEIQAAIAYDEAARQFFGEFAHLNFP